VQDIQLHVISELSDEESSYLPDDAALWPAAVPEPCPLSCQHPTHLSGPWGIPVSSLS
jgi:hypothetical protein